VNHLFGVGRWLLAIALGCLCLWFLMTWEVRVAYLDLAGYSRLWTIFAAATTAGLSVCIAFRYQQTLLLSCLIAALAVISFVLYFEFSNGGIGEYPASLRGEVNFKALLVHTGMIGSILLACHGTLARPDRLRAFFFVIGRAVIGSYFIINALWQWYYFDIRVEHVEATGGNPAIIPIAIGLQLICGGLLATGAWTKWVAWPLVLIIVASTAMVHGDLSPTAPYPVNIQVQQWFVKSTILAGVLMSIVQPPPMSLRND
jgi:uncharacterized membrane protein YphA (DoxX/SURF4 family)